MKRQFRWATGLLQLMLSSTALASAGFQPGNILIGHDNLLREYNFAGDLVRQLVIPDNAANEISRDITVLQDGRLAVYNGTFYPELALYDGVGWQSSSYPGWSTVNNVTYGGITGFAGEVIVTDSFTYNGGEARGLVSIDPDNQSHERFVTSTDYIDVTLGHDGLLYALRNVYGDLDVFDPVSRTLIRSLDLGHTSSSRGIAANRNGEIFMVSLDGYVAHYSAGGELLNTLPIISYLSDIDLDSAGRIIVGSSYYQAYVTDESLSTFTLLTPGNGNTFVAFVPFDTPELAGTHRRQGRWIVTTLTWKAAAPAVDIYLNGDLVETVSGTSTATYQYFKKLSQVFVVCNAGTSDCSNGYVAN